MANQYRPWSDKELNQLRELAGDFSARDLSKKIGRGYDAIQKMVRKLDLPRFPHVPHKSRATAPKPEPPTNQVLRLPEPLRPQKERTSHVTYPPLEWCGQCRIHLYQTGVTTQRV